jgi:DNA polymerase III alpha subunit
VPKASSSDLNDFARRVDLRAVGKRSLECLIKVGALDQFGNRASMLGSLDRIVAISSNHFRAADAGQMSLFGTTTGIIEEITLPEVKDVEKRDMLNWERELIGLYISDHPLNEFQTQLAQIVSYFSGQLSEASHEEKVRVAGLITVVRPYTTKTGKPMGFVTIEDIQGNIELVLFPKTWEKFREILTVGQIIIVEGKVDQGNPPAKILVDIVRTEITMTVPADDQYAKQDLTPKPLLPRTETDAPRRPTNASTAKPTTAPEPKQNAPVQTRKTRSKTINRISRLKARPSQKPQTVAEARAKAAAFTSPPNPVYDLDDDMPPPPDNFPDGWDSEWQPSFDEAAVAAKPEPKFKKNEEVTPPLVTRALAALPNVEEMEQAEDKHEAFHSVAVCSAGKRRIKTRNIRRSRSPSPCARRATTTATSAASRPCTAR